MSPDRGLRIDGRSGRGPAPLPIEQQTTELDDSLRVIALEVADDLAELARVRAWADRLLQDLQKTSRSTHSWWSTS
ncbi:hypothetical protein AB0F15_17065 [Amycolatopsis sp. NPDC026612]|uniref:hypothetical protein n=1 Tax=Amycolatopsis sp. NPDC026612 TaxID=3155466 RepID=UPI0033E2E562